MESTKVAEAMELSKQANALINKCINLLTEKKDIDHFKPVPIIFNNASGMVHGNEACAAILKGWMVSQANNAAFIIWRRGLMTPEIEEEYRKLPSTEEATADFEAYEKDQAAKAAELEDARKEFMDGQRATDIFKAVLNGMSKDKAEEEYNKMQAQINGAVKKA